MEQTFKIIGADLEPNPGIFETLKCNQVVKYTLLRLPILTTGVRSRGLGLGIPCKSKVSEQADYSNQNSGSLTSHRCWS